jgi:CheY-like chemotaxis protein
MPVILIADDDAKICAMMQKLLTRAGHVVHLAATGLEADKIIGEQAIDLLITDIVMPEKEGLTLVREIHRRMPKIKIIAMSGGGRAGAFTILDAAAQFGANLVLQKPFRAGELLQAITSVLGASAP